MQKITEKNSLGYASGSRQSCYKSEVPSIWGTQGWIYTMSLLNLDLRIQDLKNTALRNLYWMLSVCSFLHWWTQMDAVISSFIQSQIYFQISVFLLWLYNHQKANVPKCMSLQRPEDGGEHCASTHPRSSNDITVLGCLGTWNNDFVSVVAWNRGFKRWRP